MLQERVIADNNPPIENMPSPISPLAPAANNVAHTDVKMEMLRFLQEMLQSNAGRSGRDERDVRVGRGRGSCEINRCTPKKR